jgi:hypothetical protein
MSKLTAERKVREYNRGQKAAKNGRSVIGVDLRHIRSNPMNIMKDAQRRSTRAMMISFGRSSGQEGSRSSAHNCRVFLQPNYADQVFEK